MNLKLDQTRSVQAIKSKPLEVQIKNMCPTYESKILLFVYVRLMRAPVLPQSFQLVASVLRWRVTVETHVFSQQMVQN